MSSRKSFEGHPGMDTPIDIRPSMLGYPGSARMSTARCPGGSRRPGLNVSGARRVSVLGCRCRGVFLEVTFIVSLGTAPGFAARHQKRLYPIMEIYPIECRGLLSRCSRGLIRSARAREGALEQSPTVRFWLSNTRACRYHRPTREPTGLVRLAKIISRLGV